jgi:hypothetical protein
MTQHSLPCSTQIGDRTSCLLEENRNISNRYSGSQLSEVQKPHPQPPPRKR